jgi:type 1 fimbriae regulatory protein FimB/type 1 fimbriae regulatory protein FimE
MQGTPATPPIVGLSCARFAAYSANKSHDRRSSSRRSAVRRSRLLGSLAWSNAPVEPPAGCRFKAHPHMLRHACGFALANEGHDTRALQAYLGHKNIQHTVRYTELAPTRFKNFWR